MQLLVNLSDADVERIAALVVSRLTESLAIKSDPSHSAMQLYNERDAARFLGVSASTLKRWRLEGRVRATRSVRPVAYSASDIEAAKAVGGAN